VIFEWDEPETNLREIIEYEIKIWNGLEYEENPTYCNGLTTISSRKCEIEMETLKLEFGVQNGDIIKAIVKARNGDGWSIDSD
jgi:hypothetical protein